MTGPLPMRPCGVCRQPAAGGNCPRHPKRGGYRPGRRSVTTRAYGPAYRLARSAVLIRDAYRCVYCTRPGDTADHVIPGSKGGEPTTGNMVCACQFCNTSKGNRTLLEWIKSGCAPRNARAVADDRAKRGLPS
jgi:5-methylcytosine-specific restriction endonuclease McrA